MEPVVVSFENLSNLGSLLLARVVTRSSETQKSSLLFRTTSLHKGLALSAVESKLKISYSERLDIKSVLAAVI